MKFAIALYSAAHSPSSRRALRFAEAALAGGHEIVRLFFYQDGVHSASSTIVTPQDDQDIAQQWATLSLKTSLMVWCALLLPYDAEY